ncbi:MAG TPA: PGPGW domain-containing protein, partial [Solirubrobacteraceae bacterium]
FTVVLAGIAMLLLPGPALAVIPVGLAMLALEFAWAERLLDKALAQADAAERKAAQSTPAKRALAASEGLRKKVLDALFGAEEEFEYTSTTTSTTGGTTGGATTPTKVLMDDKRLHKELKRSADALRDASAALREAPKHTKPKAKKRKGGFGRILLVAILGGGIALAVSEGLRNKVLDALFGAEEEFDYTSNTAPAAVPEQAPAS